MELAVVVSIALGSVFVVLLVHGRVKYSDMEKKYLELVPRYSSVCKEHACIAAAFNCVHDQVREELAKECSDNLDIANKTAREASKIYDENTVIRRRYGELAGHLTDVRKKYLKVREDCLALKCELSKAENWARSDDAYGRRLDD